jgi:hypothetical protein
LVIAHPSQGVSDANNLDFAGGRVKTAAAMEISMLGVRILAVSLVAATALGARAGHAIHVCDPVTNTGWNVVASEETVSESDSAPFADGAPGDWFVRRTTVYIPFCNYYNELGIYSMRSYTLAPATREGRIAICQGSPQGISVPIAPYTGACPPR